MLRALLKSARHKVGRVPREVLLPRVFEESGAWVSLGIVERGARNGGED